MRRTRGSPRRRRRARRSVGTRARCSRRESNPGTPYRSPERLRRRRRRRKNDRVRRRHAASPLSHTSSHSPSSIIIPDLSDNKGVKARARAAQRTQLELVEAEERAAFEAAAAEVSLFLFAYG